MIKKSFFVGVLSALLFACGSSNSDEVKLSSGEGITDEEHVEEIVEPNVFIRGTFKGGAKHTLVLEALTEAGSVEIARAKANDQGVFELSGTIRELGLYQLTDGSQPAMQGQQPKSIPLTLVPGDEVELSLDDADFNFSVVYAGTEWADALNKYIAEMNTFIEWQKSVVNPEQYYTSPEKQAELMKMIMENKKPMDDFIINEIKASPSNPAHILLMTNLLPVGGFDYYDESYIDALKLIHEAYEEKYAGRVVTLSIGQQIAELDQGYMDYKAYVLNKEAPEISLPNPDGEEMKLSSLRGNYVLIDFWASWCQPCRIENPNVVRLYNKYKDKNFEIFSVSLDDNKEQWVKAIQADGLVWKHHVSDLLKWNTPMTQKYQFNGIPHTVLIDPEGKIIATQLRGQSLERKLYEIFES